MAWCRDRHFPQELRPDLMAKAARATVYADDDVAQPQPEGRGDYVIVHDGYLLHLKVMVTRAQGSHFVPLALLGLR